MSASTRYKASASSVFLRPIMYYCVSFGDGCRIRLGANPTQADGDAIGAGPGGVVAGTHSRIFSAVLKGMVNIPDVILNELVRLIEGFEVPAVEFLGFLFLRCGGFGAGEVLL